MNWTTVALGEIADIERKSVAPANITSGSRYVGLEHIESGGSSLSFGEVESGELASNKFRFGPQHILFGKLRPYLAKIVSPSFEGICSTDILPIAPGKRVDQRYLLHFLRRPQTVEWAASRATGVNLPRLSPSELESLEIPLPPLDEQRRIAAILDKADDLRRKRKRALELLDGLTQSIFLDIFGEMTGVGTLKFPTVPFSDLVKSQKIGVVRSANQLSVDATTPYLRMDSITANGKLDIQNIKRTKASKADLAEYELEKGDFLFNTRNSKELVGKTAVFDGPTGFIYNNNILRVRFSDRILPDYAAAFFRTRYAQNELELRKSGTTSVFAIYQKSLETLPIALPPIELQTEFVTRIAKIRDVANRTRGSQVAIASLFSSLQSRAFSGQL